MELIQIVCGVYVLQELKIIANMHTIKSSFTIKSVIIE